MSRPWAGSRILFGVATVCFVLLQVRLFSTQSQYTEQIATATKSENECTLRSRKLVDQLSTYHGKVISLQEEKKQLALDNQYLSTVIDDLKRHEKVVKPSQDNNGESVAAVVIMACNRADYLERTIKSVLKYHSPVATKFPLFISQDGSFLGVETMARNYPEFHFMQHLDFEQPKKARAGELIAYYKISSHYKWALQQLFGERKYHRVIILEDDMEIAPDFFDYFESMAQLLDKDSTLMAASSWNDNGQRQFVYDSEILYRSDFFPGLGWMLNKNIWEELAPRWPAAYWDDWLRLAENRKGRHFIRPEVCRTYNFGEHGSSMGQFFKEYLEPIKLNDKLLTELAHFETFLEPTLATETNGIGSLNYLVNWKAKNLSYLLEPNYSAEFGSLVAQAMPINANRALQEVSKVDGDVRVEYSSQGQFEHLAAQFGVFREWKDHVPRTAYKGVVVFRWQGSKRVFFVSSDSPLIQDQ